jgi:hypothetical protein
MSTKLGSEFRLVSSREAGTKVFALICVYLTLTVALGVTRSLLEDAGGRHVAARSSSVSYVESKQ